MKAVRDVHEQIESEYHAKLQAVADYDLTAFSELMSPGEPPAKHHVFLCEHLMRIERGDVLRLLISMPPGHAKTHYSSIMFPAWYIGRHPDFKYMQVGHTQAFCNNKMGKPVRDLLSSMEYRKVFPTVRLSPHSKAADFWGVAQPHKGSYLARGVGGGIAGFRANCAGIDDPFRHREDAESQVYRDKVFDWYSADFVPRLLPYAALFIVATRWHSDDLCGRVEAMSQAGQGFPFEIINLPCIYDEEVDGGDPMGREIGQVLWPDFYTLDYMLQLKATTPPRDWNSLYQGKPVDEEGGLISFADGKIPRYTTLPPQSRWRRITISVDCAQKADQRNDYTVITVWIESDTHQHYLVEVVRVRAEFNEMVQTIERVAMRHRASAILVEDRGSGTQYIQTRRGKAPAPVIAISTVNHSKEFRFDATLPMWQAGEVVLPDRAVWLADYERELVGFPNGKYDDQVDSTSQYLEWARKRGAGGTKPLVGLSIGDNRAKPMVAPEGIDDRPIMAPVHQPLSPPEIAERVIRSKPIVR